MPFQDDTPIWAPVYRLEQTDQVLGGIPDRMTGAGKSNWPHEDLARRTAYLKQEIDYLSMTASVEVTVGAAGDFLTINEALAALSRRRQGYVRGGVSATVRLLAGFTMAEQVIVSGVNLGWITIVGDDPSTTINRAYLIDLIPGGAGYAAFSALEAGVLPKIGQLFQMNTAGAATDRHGISLVNGSSATVAVGKGVQNAGGIGARVSTCSGMIAMYGDFRNSGSHGIYATAASEVSCANVNARNCVGIGLYATSGSRINAINADVQGCGVSGITAAQASLIHAANTNARMGAADSSQDIRVSASGIIDAVGTTGGTSVAVNTWNASGWIGR